MVTWKNTFGIAQRLEEHESLELERALTGGHLDVARLGTLERDRRQALQVIDGLGEAGAQLLDGGLVVLEARRLVGSEARHGVLGDVARRSGSGGSSGSMSGDRRAARNTDGSILRVRGVVRGAFSRSHERLPRVLLKRSTEKACMGFFMADFPLDDPGAADSSPLGSGASASRVKQYAHSKWGLRLP